eukprot:gnl/MRDRNA2_/MRDRNA2_157623_c0_seq1.p1 gnl/MRDRNA2_/MRDRNA2_157623_c0~~gnl/MRDRNA2_/MRDRNA2_157623_c0_seq1.p1  ORF type:complete len:283 (+),score=32.66 gnl/MRDRNA2_/MRDRNA2_157623_c0_seq1:64-912(+)
MAEGKLPHRIEQGFGSSSPSGHRDEGFLSASASSHHSARQARSPLAQLGTALKIHEKQRRVSQKATRGTIAPLAVAHKQYPVSSSRSSTGYSSHCPTYFPETTYGGAASSSAVGYSSNIAPCFFASKQHRAQDTDQTCEDHSSMALPPNHIDTINDARSPLKTALEHSPLYEHSMTPGMDKPFEENHGAFPSLRRLASPFRDRSASRSSSASLRGVEIPVDPGDIRKKPVPRSASRSPQGIAAGQNRATEVHGDSHLVQWASDGWWKSSGCVLDYFLDEPWR